MSLSQATLVSRIRYRLGDMPWETTGSAADASTPYVAVNDGTDWAVGNVGEFVNNGEDVYVSAISGDTLTTVRGYYGTTAATQASGRILKDPKYKFNEITDAISVVIQSKLPWPRVYKTVATTVSPTPTTKTWYDLASTVMGLVSVYQLDDNTNTQLGIFNRHHSNHVVELRRNLPTTLCASGVGMRFPPGTLFDQDNTVYVTYAAKITDSVTTGSYDDLTDGDAVVEAVILGAVGVLSGSLELRKQRKSADETDHIRNASYFDAQFRSALASAEKEIRQRSPLIATAAH